MLASTMLVILLILGTLARSGSACCTPTEGAGVGAVGALILAVIKGIKPREVWQVVLDVGRTSGPLLLLLFCAQLYSRVPSMTGFTEAAKDFCSAPGSVPGVSSSLWSAIWFVLGCLIDSISIIFLRFRSSRRSPCISALIPWPSPSWEFWRSKPGCSPRRSASLVFTVKSAVPDPNVELAEIFRGSIPYWIVLLGVVVALAAFPQLATFLPGL